LYLSGANTFPQNGNNQELPSPKCTRYWKQDKTLHKQQTQANLRLRITTPGYGLPFQHRDPKKFPVNSFAHDNEALIRAEYGASKESPNTSAVTALNTALASKKPSSEPHRAT
jgi:hypothetical protein